MIISCYSVAALQVGTLLHNDCTNGVRYSCPSSNGYVKEQSDEQDRRGSSAEEKVNTYVPAEVKTDAMEDARNLSRKRNGSIQESSEGFEYRSMEDFSFKKTSASKKLLLRSQTLRRNPWSF